MTFTVDTNVPYGNATDVRITQDDGTAVVQFTADPHGGPEAMWFCFRVHRDARAQARRLRLVLTNLGNLLGGRDGESIRPVHRSPGGNWQRLEPGRTEHLSDGRRNACWEIDAPETFVDVALCYPYGLAEIDELIDETRGYWRSDTIGVSQSGRALVRLSNDHGSEGQRRPGMYLLARQHSGETPGSWVLDGFLRRIASMGEAAPLVWCAPLTNIDGIEQGDYGKDNFPYDLNRAWGRPAMRHEVLVFQRDMERWRRRCRPKLVLDFHAPGMCESEGFYVFVPPEEEEGDWHGRALTWTEPMARALGPTYARDPFARVAHYGSRWHTPNSSHFARQVLGVVGLSLESPYANANNGRTLLTIEAYREAGARLATAIAEHAQMPTPSRPTSAARPGPSAD